MAFLIAVMSFANFVFWPLVIGTIIAFIIEQIMRQIGNAYDPEAIKKVQIAMSVRKYFWRQAWLFNIIWFVCYGILLFVMKPGNQPLPDMIWQG